MFFEYIMNVYLKLCMHFSFFVNKFKLKKISRPKADKNQKKEEKRQKKLKKEAKKRKFEEKKKQQIQTEVVQKK